MSFGRHALQSHYTQDNAGCYTSLLTGGEKRLVALATVLAMQPEVLLFDEPSGGLDDASTERLIGVLARLPQAMVVVSHDRAFWEAVTKSMVELKEGRMV